MSVKRTVASTRSGSGTGRVPVRNSSISSASSSTFPAAIQWSSPGSSTNFASGILEAK